jgi:hypothetical protein
MDSENSGLFGRIHGRYATFQMTEVFVSWNLFQKFLSLIDYLRQSPAAA